MRVTLVNPYYPIAETPSPPLGMAFLAGALERAGHEVQLLDYVVYPYSKQILQKALERFQPSLIGVTAVTMSFPAAAEVIRDAKDIDSGLLTMMGGPHVTFRAENTLLELPELDVIVLGEGEDTLIELVAAHGAGQSFEGVAGMVYRDADGPRRTAVRPLIKDIDALPKPSRGHIALGRYRALHMPVSMTTSRGCPFKCIFCVGRKMVGAKVRYHSTNRVVDEFQELAQWGFHQINIADDLFTANKQHCLSICAEMRARGIEHKWTSFSRVDTVAPEVLAAMHKAGCTDISFGVETGDPEMMKRIKKGITLEQVEIAVKMAKDAGLSPHASFILGLPGENEQTLANTMAFAQKIEALGCCYGFHLLAPFPGTDICENLDQYDIKVLTDDWAEYHANRAIVETSQASQSRLNGIIEKWDQEFIAELGKMKRKYLAGTASEFEAAQVLGLDRTCVTHDLMMGDLMERFGRVEAADLSTNNGNGLEAISAKLEDHLKFNQSEILDALQYNVANGSLVGAEQDGGMTWRWLDYLN